MTEYPKTPPRTPIHRLRKAEAPKIPNTPPRTPIHRLRKEEAPKIPSPAKTPKTSKKKIQTSREIAEILALVDSAEKMRVIEIVDGANLTEERLATLVKNKVPLVFRGLASKWKCVQNWSKPDYLRKAAKKEAEKCPHRKYRQFTAHSAGRLHLTDGKSKALPVSMHDFLEHAETVSDGLYLLGIHSVHSGSLSYCPVQPHKDDKEAHAPLVADVPQDIDFLEWYAKLLSKDDPVRFDHQQFFLAKGYAFTDLHYDSYDNFYVAVSGTRRWTLACPNASRWLVSGGKLKSGSEAIPHLNSFDTGSPAAMYPFAYVDLLPGDVLFVPTCWWHLVESKAGNDGFSSAFNFFFSKPPDEVYGEFLAQLAESDSLVSRLQKECRARIAQACLEPPSGKTSHTPAPEGLDTQTWTQLENIAKDHCIDLTAFKQKWDTHSIESVTLEVPKKSIKKKVTRNTTNKENVDKKDHNVNNVAN